MASRQDVMHTLNAFYDYEFSWTIDNFSWTPNVFLGPAFAPVPGLSTKFYFEMKFSWISNTESYLILNMHKCDGKSDNFNMMWDLYLQDTNAKIWRRCKTIFFQVTKVNFTKFDCKGRRKENIQDLYPLPGNKLVLKGTLRCFGYNLKSILNKHSTKQNLNGCQQVVNDLRTMYRDGVESDITFLVEDKTIGAHKSIIASRSPVFARMLTHDMQERRSNRIVIKDIEHDVLDCFLLFLYTGEVLDTTWETVLKLYSLADKYEVKSLQRACSQILGDGLMVDSVCKVLVLSELHSDAELKETAMNFIHEHFNGVGKTSDWSEIVATKPQLASEVLSYVTSAFAK